MGAVCVIEKRKQSLATVTQTKNEMVLSLHTILARNHGTGKTMIGRYMAGESFHSKLQ